MRHLCHKRVTLYHFPPCILIPFPGLPCPSLLLRPVLMIGDLQDKPGLPQSLSVPTPCLPHPILTCSGLQLLADIWKENEVIYIIKTNCLTSVRLHCCAIMEWFRCFVRRGAGGKLLSHPGNVIAAPQSSLWRDLGWLEQDTAVVSGRKHKTKIEDSELRKSAFSTLSIWWNAWSHCWSERGHSVFPRWPATATSLPLQWGIFSFFACFHPLPLPFLVLWCHRESVFKIILGFQIKGDQMDVKSRQLNAVCDPWLNPGTGVGLRVGEPVKDIMRTSGRIGMQTVDLMLVLYHG